MNEKYKSLTKAELLAYMLQNRFYELFLGQPKKARDLINDLWNMMIPYPNHENRKYLFENTFKEWMFTVEGEIK